MTRFLVVLDVDSTLIQDEVIELLADKAGVRAEVTEITERAMRGEIDFAQSLAQRVSTLEDLPSSVLEETFKAVRVTEGAEDLIAAVHNRGGKIGVVSGGFIQVLEPLARKLHLDFYSANHLEVLDSKLTGKVVGKVIDAQAKAAALFEWASDCDLHLSQTIAVGDGANDLLMMDEAGLSIAFNAKPIVRERANLVVHSNDLREIIGLLPSKF